MIENSEKPTHEVCNEDAKEDTTNPLECSSSNQLSVEVSKKY